jgi:hypothetical protein
MQSCFLLLPSSRMTPVSLATERESIEREKYTWQLGIHNCVFTLQARLSSRAAPLRCMHALLGPALAQCVGAFSSRVTHNPFLMRSTSHTRQSCVIDSATVSFTFYSGQELIFENLTSQHGEAEKRESCACCGSCWAWGFLCESCERVMINDVGAWKGEFWIIEWKKRDDQQVAKMNEKFKSTKLF